MKEENIFKAIDDAADVAAIERVHAETKRRHIMDKVLNCVHRVPTGFYNVKCHHPARDKYSQGEFRQCIDTDCPRFKGAL